VFHRDVAIQAYSSILVVYADTCQKHVRLASTVIEAPLDGWQVGTVETVCVTWACCAAPEGCIVESLELQVEALALQEDTTQRIRMQLNSSWS
jgi:hypothetical protein